jgi:hypothetical protein
MAIPGEKRLIERRRSLSDQQPPECLFEKDSPRNRRESDQLRARLERWSQLADAALGGNRNGNAHVHRGGKTKSRAKAAN